MNERARDTQYRSALSFRALLVGVVCVVITCFVVCYAELVVGQIQVGFLQLPPVVIGMLVLVLGTQAVLSRLNSRLRLASHELFTVYVMMLLASMVSSRGLLQKLIPLLIVPNYLATPENGWQGHFYKYLRSWAVPFDPTGDPKQFVATRFYEGLRFGEHIPWLLWVRPLCSWGLFVVLLFTAYLCLAVILRRQWVDNEKLAFPLVQLPLEMVRSDAEGGSFLKNRMTWLGFLLPALLFGFNGLHQWFPGIPDVTTEVDLNALFHDRPWNGMTYFHLFPSLAAVGFFYLLPTDVTFSFWFFFLLTKVEEVGASALGYEPVTMPLMGCKEFIGYQVVGCYFVLAGTMIWQARPHLKRVWRCAVSRLAPEGYGSDELISYRTALWGLILSILLSAAWLWLLGMTYWLALLELCILIFVVALVMARSTCEGGMLMTETSFRPVDIFRMFGDVRNLGGQNITCMAFMDGLLMRDLRGLILTGFLDSMKGADAVRVRRRSLMGVFLAAFAVALGVSGALHIVLPYHRGAVTMYGYVYRGNPVWAFNEASAVLDHQRPQLSAWTLAYTGIGVIVTLALTALRARYAWFPFHPLGYALSGAWSAMVFWFPCMVAWLCKVLILRYGGKKLYLQLRPFFLGMVLGEFTMAVVWSIPSIFYNTPTPFFPWP